MVKEAIGLFNHEDKGTVVDAECHGMQFDPIHIPMSTKWKALRGYTIKVTKNRTETVIASTSVWSTEATKE